MEADRVWLFATCDETSSRTFAEAGVEVCKTLLLGTGQASLGWFADSEPWY
jgi:hypothetical protein